MAKKNPGVRYTEEQKKAILAEIDAGASAKSVAEKHHVSYASLMNWRKGGSKPVKRVGNAAVNAEVAQRYMREAWIAGVEKTISALVAKEKKVLAIKLLLPEWAGKLDSAAQSKMFLLATECIQECLGKHGIRNPVYSELLESDGMGIVVPLELSYTELRLP